jgi:thiol-disulfide isomerase/thioredoxin
MRRGIRIGIGLAALASIQAIAWLAYRSVEDGRGSAPKSALFHYEALSTAAPAGEVALERPDGSVIRLRDFEGDAVILHFWATWCAPCRTELPMLLDLAKQAPGHPRVVVLLVSVDESWATVRHFFNGNVPAAILRDGTGALKGAYAVTTLPDTYVLQRGGIVAARMRGSRDWSSSAARDAAAKIVNP